MNSASRLLAVVIVLQVFTLAGQWFGPRDYAAPAAAQVADGGAQRIQIIEQLKESNAKLEKLVDILKDGVVQVRVARAEEKK